MGTPVFPASSYRTYLDKAFWKSVAINGVAVPDEPFIHFQGSGFTVTDDPTNGATVVAITASPTEDQAQLTAAIASSALVSGRMYIWAPLSTGFTQALPTSPAAGMRFGFCDVSGLWVPSGTKNLTLDPGPNKILDPHYINTTAATGTSWKTSPGAVLDSPYATVWVTWCATPGVWRTE